LLLILADSEVDEQAAAKGLRPQPLRNYKSPMTTLEFCNAAGICRSTLQQWIEAGYLRAENVGLPGGGMRRVFDAGQLSRARLLKALLRKGVPLAQIAGADLAFDGQAFIIFDGHELRACRDAADAIGAVVRARRPCAAVDLAAIRQG
jgi:hypothetical protein